jgi:hypothetical protein
MQPSPEPRLSKLISFMTSGRAVARFGARGGYDSVFDLRYASL